MRLEEAHSSEVSTLSEGELQRGMDSDLLVGSGTRDTALLLRVPQVAQLLGLGRSKVYAMVGAGELPIVRIGTAVRVPKRELEAWIERRTQKAA